MSKVVGVGKVVNGRITFVGELGGYSRPVNRPVVAPVVEEAIVKETVAPVAREVLDIPAFMKEYSKNRRPVQRTVIHVNFREAR